ncbi:D-amino-acid transaminase [Brevundimonas sp.]|uniref:D-amino-acid transaminase n=1 Tax=Brevundimonas sp. TaxID=1871086 RepID=UPI002FC76939
MSRVAYVNGTYQAHGNAVVHIEDRGFQFADGVYEVWSVFDGKLADYEGHMQRLGRSLTELRIDIPMTAQALGIVLRETIRRNRVRNGIVYIQITRGTAPRDHAFPKGVAPSVIVTSKPIDLSKGEALAAKGATAVSHPDTRWGRCDIKTVGLLPNALAKQAAREKGAYEAILFDEMGMVTEGSSTNAWIVDEHGKLRTRDTQANILRGITRAAIMKLVAEEGIELDERAFSLEEAKRAKELFVTAASSFVMPLVSLDGEKIADGKPGPIATLLREVYLAQARREAI